MKPALSVLLSLLVFALWSAPVFAKKAKEPPICSYGKTEFINARETYHYRSRKACTLKNGARWLCHKKQKKGHRLLKKLVRKITNNLYSKVSYKLKPFSFKGKSRRQSNGKCKLTIRQLTCRYVSCNFN